MHTHTEDPNFKKPQESINYAGMWFMIHILAKSAIDYPSQRNFIHTMNTMSKNFLCSECGKHFRSYLENNKIEDYLRTDDQKEKALGCFKWSCDFHNNVNARLKKPIYDFGTCYGLYYGVDESGGICTAKCASG